MLQKTLNFIKKNIFLIFFGIYCSIGIISQSEYISFNLISKALSLSIYVIYYSVLTLVFLFSIFKWLKFSYFKLVLIILGILVNIFSTQLSILTMALFLYAFSAEDFKNVAKVAFFSISITFLFVVASSLLNIIPNISYSRNEKIRYALGFTYATLPQSLCLFMLLYRAYIRKSKMHYLEILAFAILVCVIYYLTDTRSGCLISLCCCAIILISKFIKDKEKINCIFNVKWLRSTIILLPLLSFLLFTVLFIFYNEKSPIFVKLDNVFSFRLSLTKKAFFEQQITLFGKPIKWNVNGEYIGVDNSFYRMFFDTGIFGALITLVLSTTAMIYAVKNKDLCFILIFIAVLVDSFVEPYIIDTRFNCFILYNSSFIFKELFSNKKDHKLKTT